MPPSPHHVLPRWLSVCLVLPIHDIVRGMEQRQEEQHISALANAVYEVGEQDRTIADDPSINPSRIRSDLQDAAVEIAWDLARFSLHFAGDALHENGWASQSLGEIELASLGLLLTFGATNERYLPAIEGFLNREANVRKLDFDDFAHLASHLISSRREMDGEQSDGFLRLLNMVSQFGSVELADEVASLGRNLPLPEQSVFCLVHWHQLMNCSPLRFLLAIEH